MCVGHLFAWAVQFSDAPGVLQVGDLGVVSHEDLAISEGDQSSHLSPISCGLVKLLVQAEWYSVSGEQVSSLYRPDVFLAVEADLLHWLRQPGEESQESPHSELSHCVVVILFRHSLIFTNECFHELKLSVFDTVSSLILVINDLSYIWNCEKLKICHCSFPSISYLHVIHSRILDYLYLCLLFQIYFTVNKQTSSQIQWSPKVCIKLLECCVVQAMILT